MLATIREARFRTWVGPDEEVTIYAEISTNRSAHATADCYLKVNSEKVASGQLFFIFAPDEQFAPDYRDEVIEAYWRSNPSAYKARSG
jgi:hypothetical protein